MSSMSTHINWDRPLGTAADAFCGMSRLTAEDLPSDRMLAAESLLLPDRSRHTRAVRRRSAFTPSSVTADPVNDSTTNERL
jgi:hypothetical protein